MTKSSKKSTVINAHKDSKNHSTSIIGKSVFKFNQPSKELISIATDITNRIEVALNSKLPNKTWFATTVERFCKSKIWILIKKIANKVRCNVSTVNKR